MNERSLLLLIVLRDGKETAIRRSHFIGLKVFDLTAWEV